MPNLYNITQDCVQLYNNLLESIDEETGEIDTTIQSALDVKREEFETKALNVASVIKMFTFEQEKYKAEINRLTTIEKRIDKVVNKLKLSVHDACLLLGIKEIKGINSSISFKGSVKTIIDDLESLPNEYKRQKISYDADLTKIKNAIKSGIVIQGAHLEENQNLQIK